MDKKRITHSDVYWHPEKIKDIQHSEKHCLIAVKRSPEALKHIENPSEIVIKTSVRNSPSSLKYVKDITEELCLLALGWGNLDIIPVEHRTDKVINKALRKGGYNLRHVQNPTEQQCILALKEDYDMFNMIQNPTKKVTKFALNLYGYNLRHVRKEDQTPELCIIALKSSDSAYRFVQICDNPNYEETLENLLKMQLKEKIFEL